MESLIPSFRLIWRGDVGLCMCVCVCVCVEEGVSETGVTQGEFKRQSYLDPLRESEWGFFYLNFQTPLHIVLYRKKTSAVDFE